jgi:putative membrane protein
MATSTERFWRSTIAGAAGGLAGSWIMAQISTGIKRSIRSAEGVSGDTHEDEAYDPKVAVAETVLAQHPSAETARASQFVVHYGFGAAMGAVYGAVAATRPEVAVCKGIPFGFALWLAADELGLKAFGLARKSGASIEAHSVSLTTHLAFGVATEVIRNKLLREGAAPSH